MGVPAKVVRPLTDAEREGTLRNAAHYAEAGKRLLLPINS